jgi:alkanesulfonate monooxygenase SsuD/methylene tetrahydromethanopterin reductase-like flavin-dependent oxidoreductase (luciferase family)
MPETIEMGIHLPLMEFEGEGLSLDRVLGAVEAARDCGFAAVSANDHFVFSTPWLDGPTALAAVVEHSGEMRLATTISLAALRGPVPLAKTLAALDILSEGRVIAGLGPGSSERDYIALGVPFEERWKRLDETIAMLKALLRGDVPEGGTYFAAPESSLAPPPRQAEGIPLWIGSWGSEAGLRRVARAGDGWLASAYNTTPERFSDGLEYLSRELEARGRAADRFPNALVTMWTWVTENDSDADRVLNDVLAPLLKRDPAELRGQVCVGSAAMCAELLTRYTEAGCRRVHFWPLGDERRQIESLAADVAPQIGP